MRRVEITRAFAMLLLVCLIQAFSPGNPPETAAGHSESTKLLANDGDANDLLGEAVAISENLTVVGARGDNDAGVNSGSAYVFVFDGDDWEEEEKLLASDAAQADGFGWSVAISGDRVVSGSPFANDLGLLSGSAYVFERSRSRWSEEDKLLAGDGNIGDQFGYAVAVAGDTAVIGAPNAHGNVESGGAAYVFVRDGDEWTEHTKLVPGDGDPADGFGNSVSISGNYIVIGAPENEGNGPASGAAYAFYLEYTFTLTLTQAGTGTGSVSSIPLGIDCLPDCSEDYTVDTEVTLTPASDSNSFFVGWSGDAKCDDGLVTMTEDLACTAQFDLRTHVLTLLKTGSGSGTVTSNPSGIDCGTDCDEYLLGTEVTLAVDADPFSQFGGWSGDTSAWD